MPLTGTTGGMPLFTPPQTPGHHVNGSTGSMQGMSAVVGAKRESNASETSGTSSNVAAGVKRENNEEAVTEENGTREKRRRIAPTPVSDLEFSAPPAPSSTSQTKEDGSGG